MLLAAEKLCSEEPGRWGNQKATFPWSLSAYTLVTGIDSWLVRRPRPLPSQRPCSGCWEVSWFCISPESTFQQQPPVPRFLAESHRRREPFPSAPNTLFAASGFLSMHVSKFQDTQKLQRQKYLNASEHPVSMETEIKVN